MRQSAIMLMATGFLIVQAMSASAAIAQPVWGNPEFRIVQAEALAMLDRRAGDLAAKDQLSGVMLIETNGEVVYLDHWGLADRGTDLPVTLNTRFRLGSSGKMFTAVAILQLVEAGRLSLDGTVGDYLPDYPNRSIADQVTIRQMLTHTGGTGDIFTPEYEALRDQTRTLADYVSLFGAREALFEPGSQSGYSNYGFVLLGRIVEAVSGQNYYDYLRDHVFEPAGMNDTGALPEKTVMPQRAVGYMRENDRWVPATATLPYRGSPAGGGYSTVFDLLRFAHALQNGTLLSPAMVRAATTPQNPDGWYGYGFVTAGEGPTAFYGHGGGAPGMNSDFRVYPDQNTIIITLSNFDPPVANDLAEYYEDRMAAIR